MFNMPKNTNWQCLHHQLLKSTQKTQIKEYATLANVQHEENAIWLCFHLQLIKSTLESQI